MADTATYEIEFQEGERMTQLLKQYPKIAGDELHNAMTDSVRHTTLAIQKRTPLYTTKLRRSIAWTVERDIRGAEVPSITGTIGTPLVYGPAVELGLPPGTLPPEEPLIRWAAVVLGDGEAGKAVRWSIFHRGTKKPPAAMFARGWRQSRRWVSVRFRLALIRIVERLAEGGGNG